jgi:CrcB protein
LEGETVRIRSEGEPSMLRLLRGHRQSLAVVAAGGAIGTVARWGVAEMMPRNASEFPWSTWLVNVSGAFLMGVLMSVLAGDWVVFSRHTRPFLGAGLLGGYTTFSTYLLETRDLVAASHPGTATVYLLTTLFVGLFAVYAGMLAARIVTNAALKRRRGRSARNRRST